MNEGKDKKLTKIVKQLRKSVKSHKKQADYIEKVNEESNPRIPRKKGQPANSKKHSDLYTDENPKGTIHGLGFKDVATAKASVSKIRNSSRSHAHKIQAAVAMEQRAREMGKTSEAAVYRKFINSMKKKTKTMKEEVLNEISGKKANDASDAASIRAKRMQLGNRTGTDRYHPDKITKKVEQTGKFARYAKAKDQGKSSSDAAKIAKYKKSPEAKDVFKSNTGIKKFKEEKHADHEPEMIRNQLKTAGKASKRIEKHSKKIISKRGCNQR